MSLFRRVFVAAAVIWAAAIFAAASVAHQANAGPVPIGAASVVYATGRILCHQLSERSFHLQSAPMPVCARCTGIYVGAAAAAVLGAAWGWARAHGPAGYFAKTATARSLLVVAALPTLATLVYEWTTGDMPSHGMRAAAGAPLGAAVAWIIRDVN